MVDYLIDIGSDLAETGITLADAKEDTWRRVLEPLSYTGRHARADPLAVLRANGRPVFAAWLDESGVAMEADDPSTAGLVMMNYNWRAPQPLGPRALLEMRRRAQGLIVQSRHEEAAQTYLVAADRLEELGRTTEANALRGAARRLAVLDWAHDAWPDLELREVSPIRPRRGLAWTAPDRFRLRSWAGQEQEKSLGFEQVFVRMDRRGRILRDDERAIELAANRGQRETRAIRRSLGFDR